MDDPVAIVMAAATAASALAALVALVVSIVGLVRSKAASKDAQAARESATSAQWKMSEHLEAIAEAQAQAARASAALPKTWFGPAGRLSARLVQRGRGQRLIVANVGTAPVTVEAVEVDQDLLVDGAAEQIVGAELEPGEDYSLMAALTLNLRPPFTATLRWRDVAGKQHERTQRLTFS